MDELFDISVDDYPKLLWFIPIVLGCSFIIGIIEELTAYHPNAVDIILMFILLLCIGFVGWMILTKTYQYVFISSLFVFVGSIIDNPMVMQIGLTIFLVGVIVNTLYFISDMIDEHQEKKKKKKMVKK